MNVNQAIEVTVKAYKNEPGIPSHCTVRCMINDLTADNHRIYKHGYDQDRAHKIVCNKIRDYKLNR